MESALEKHLEAWNRTYSSKRNEEIRIDSWLDEYGPVLAAAGTSPILDLGCGSGNDTKYLLDRGHSVIACDYSEEAIANIKAKMPKAEASVFDMRDGMPYRDAEFQVIVSDLSIHYFTWAITVEIVKEMHRILGEGGFLLLRVNSTKDLNYGAGKGALIEDNYYCDGGIYKRFFDAGQLDDLFRDGWEIRRKREMTLHRYELAKQLWELLVRKA